MINRSQIFVIFCTGFLLLCQITYGADSLGVSAQTKTTIGVSDLIGQTVDQATASIITDRLRSELFNTGSVTVLERSQMQEVLKEQGFQQSGCASDQCAVETGQLLGVKYMVVGSIGIVGHTYTIASRLIDVATGKMVATANVDCRCEIDDILSHSTVEIARKLAQSFSTAPNSEPPKPAVAAPPMPPPPQQPAIGSLRIQTDPPGAKIAIDSTEMGLTPIDKDSVRVGSHKIRIELAGFERTVCDVSVSSGQTTEKKFSLNHTKVWKDSVEAVRRKALKDSVESARRAAKAVQNAGKPTANKHSVAPKIVFGVLAVGSGVAGVVFNNLEKKKLDDGASLKQQYVSSDYNNASDYQGGLDNDSKAAKNFNTTRNISYIAAGACVVGFAISFAF